MMPANYHVLVLWNGRMDRCSLGEEFQKTRKELMVSSTRGGTR